LIKLFFLLLCAANFLFAQNFELNPQSSSRVGYLYIGKERPIDESTYIYVKLALEEFKKLKVPFVVLHLNTPGGEVFASQKIAEELQKLDRDEKIPVVAYIDNWAISAGAMLAYSCRTIVATKTASMGAAMPIMVGQDGETHSASEKINSALRAEFANLANVYGRNPLLAEAMVDKELILVKRAGQIVRLDEQSQISTTGKNPDLIISGKGKLLTLSAQQLMEYGVADMMAPSIPLESITVSEQKLGEWPAQKSALFHLAPFSTISNATLVSYQDWRISFFSFLAHPMVASLLTMGLLVGIYLEVNHPGALIPGGIALLCLGLILINSFAMQSLTILPSFKDVHFSLDGETLNLATQAFLKGLAYLSATAMASCAVIALITRFFIFKRLALKGEQNASDGYVACSCDAALIGRQALCLSDLKPSGHILVEGKSFQALSESGYLYKDAAVLISGTRGGCYLVKQVTQG
jgi:membrane-bound ClpP family serine protease